VGSYLTDAQIEVIREELAIIQALPYAQDLVGTAWEQILAAVKGGIWTGKRDNRPRPDFFVLQDERRINYSAARRTAADFLGYHEDLIIARPNVESLLAKGEVIATLDANALGSKVLTYYQQEIVARYEWHVIACLLRLGSREYIYWEESPPALYNPDDYWWIDSGKATSGNRNISGYPKEIRATALPLPPAKFKWTSGGKQFYIRYTIPLNADTWTIDDIALDAKVMLDALREKLRAKQRIQGLRSPT
jgi:hypothetical protein